MISVRVVILQRRLFYGRNFHAIFKVAFVWLSLASARFDNANEAHDLKILAGKTTKNRLL